MGTPSTDARSLVHTVAITGLVAGAAATATTGMFLALGDGDTLAARMLGLSGMVGALLGAVGAVRSFGTGTKAALAVGSVLLLVASSTAYGLTWS